MIEDINLAPMEILTSLVPLIENGELPNPQRSEILSAKTGFQIISTITSAPKGASVGAYGSSEIFQVPSEAFNAQKCL